MREKYTVSLKHNEKVSEITNVETGEIRKPKNSHLPDGKSMINGNYNKVYK